MINQRFSLFDSTSFHSNVHCDWLAKESLVCVAFYAYENLFSASAKNFVYTRKSLALRFV